MRNTAEGSSDELDVHSDTAPLHLSTYILRSSRITPLIRSCSVSAYVHRLPARPIDARGAHASRIQDQLSAPDT